MSLRFIAEQMANLDAKLAEALTSTIQNLPIGDIPEVNPIQMMIMQMIQDNMASNPSKIVNRAPDGQFAAKSGPESEQWLLANCFTAWEYGTTQEIKETTRP